MCCSRLSDRWKSGRRWTQMPQMAQMDADERAAADPLKKFVPIFCSLCVDLRTSASSASAFDIENGLSGRTARFAQDDKRVRATPRDLDRWSRVGRRSWEL